MKAKEFLKELGPWSYANRGELGNGINLDMADFTTIGDRKLEKKAFNDFVNTLEYDFLPWKDLRGGTQDTKVWYASNTKDIIALQPTSSSGSTSPTRYIRKDYVNEGAGAGVLTKQNTTADVKKGTLKKQGRKFGFNITDGGIPPQISKDSVKK